MGENFFIYFQFCVFLNPLPAGRRRPNNVILTSERSLDETLKQRLKKVMYLQGQGFPSFLTFEGQSNYTQGIIQSMDLAASR